MDYHSMKRRELQALCKKHNIPANSANSVLADKLTELLNEKQKPIARQRTCIKSSVETTDEGEPAMSKKQAKKVRFSPNNDLVEYEPGKKQMPLVANTKVKRKSIAKKVDISVIDDNDAVELNEPGAQAPARLTRSRVQGKEAVKDVEKRTDIVKGTEGNLGKVTRSKALTFGKGAIDENKPRKRTVKDDENASESVDGTVVGRARVTRSKAETKMSGKQGAKDVQIVEQTKEIMDIPDIPARVTRSRGQTSKEDIKSKLNSPLYGRKRTRREMKLTDTSENASNVAPEDDEKLPKRKSMRTRGAKNMDEDEIDKVEVVNESRVTRLKSPLAKKSSGRNNKSKTENKVEPLKHAGKEKVTERKSVVQVDKTEAVSYHEEPVKRQTRKSVVNQRSKVQSDEVKENVTRSRKSASEKETKTVSNGSGSLKSRKQRGNSVIEDQTVETEFVSPVDESPNRSTRSTSKSERKVIAGKQLESSIKRPASRKDAITRDSSSNKRIKLSGTKQSDSKDRTVKSNEDATPVSKIGNFELHEEVIETEVTPAIDESCRPFTRTATRSERKESNESALKEQSQLFSPKVTKFRADPVLNTAPGRITRSGIKLGRNPESNIVKKTDKKKASQSARLRECVDNDARISSPEVSEVRHDEDVIIDVQSESRSNPDVTLAQSEIRPNLDVTIESQSEIRSNPVVPPLEVKSEIGPNPDGTVELQSEIRSSPDLAEGSKSEFRPSPDVAVKSQSEIRPTSDLAIESLFETRPIADVTIESQSKFSLSPDLAAGSQSQIRLNSDVTLESQSEIILNPYVTLESNSEVRPDPDLALESPYEIRPYPDVPEKSESEIRPNSYVTLESQSEISTDPDVTVASQSDFMSNPDVTVESQSELPNPDYHIEAQSELPNPDHPVESHSEVRPNTDVAIVSKPESGPNPDVAVESQIEDRPNQDVTAESQFDTRPNLDVAIVSKPESGPNPDVAVESQIEDRLNQNVTSESQFETRTNLDVPVGIQSEIKPNLDVLIENQFENSEELTVQILEKSVDLSASEPMMLPTKVIKENQDSGAVTAVITETTSPISGESLDSYLISNESFARAKDFVATPSGEDISNIKRTPFSTAGYAETVAGVITDGSTVQNQNVDVNSSLFDEAEVQVAVNIQKSVMVSGKPDAYENSSLDDSLEDVENKCDSISYNVGSSAACQLSFEQSDVKSKNKEVEEPDENDIEDDMHKVPILGQFDGEDNTDDFGKEYMKEPEYEVVQSTGDDVYEIPILGKSDGEDGKYETGVSTAHIMLEDPVLSSEVDAGEMDSVVGEYDVEPKSDDTPKQSSVDDRFHQGHAINEYDINDDQETNLKPLTGNDVEEDDVSSDKCENMPVLTEILVNSDLSTSKEATQNPDTSGSDGAETACDDREELLDINKDVVSNISDELENTTYFIDSKDYSGLEEKVIGVPSKEGERVSPVIHHASSDEEEQKVATVDRDWDSGKFFEDMSNIGVDYENPTREECPVGDTVSDFHKEDDINEQDSSLKSFFTTPAASRISNVKNNQEDAVNFADQDHYSFLKPLFTTPATCQISHLKKSQEDADNLASQDHYSSLNSSTPATSRISHMKHSQEDAIQDNYSSLKSLFTTPAASQISHLKHRQEDAVNIPSQDQYSSLKSLFATPAATTQITHVKDVEADTVSFAFYEDRCNEDIGRRTPTHELTNQSEIEPSKVYNCENEMYRDPNIEDFTRKYFEDDVGGSSDMSAKNKHFMFEGDNEADEFKEHDLSIETAGTSHNTKDGTIHSDEFEMKEEAGLKGSETGEYDLGFDKGM